MEFRWPTRRRIAITGLFNSGKTVFLTSLLDQFHNAAQNFFLGEKHSATIEHFQKQSVRGEAFPYDTCRTALVAERKFPLKTLAPSSYRFSFSRSDSRWRRYNVELFDFPGERFGDVSMVGHAYAAWSDAILDAWRQSECDYLRSYLTQSEGPTATKHSVIAAFREFLGLRLLMARPHICPSSFKFSAGGDALKGQTLQAVLACDSAVGIDSAQQFAPLSAAARTTHPKLAKLFARHYGAYRKHVEPLFRRVRRCDRLIILVDVLGMLQNGHISTNDNHHLLEALLQTAAKPSWWRYGIKRIAIVAPKSDLAATDDHDALVALLEQMTKAVTKQLRGVEIRHFAASAVVSTKSIATAGDNFATLQGRPIYGSGPGGIKVLGPNGPLEKFQVPRLPHTWPTRWQPGDYQFVDVYPDVPQAKFSAIKHREVDRVFNFVAT